MLGNDLSIWNPTIFGRRIWTPHELFANGQNGDYVDENVLSSMTIGRDGSGGPPAANDVVGTITGLVNGIVFPADSDARRPILRLSNGRYRLEFDGVDDRMFSSDIPAFHSINTLGLACFASHTQYLSSKSSMSVNNSNALQSIIFNPLDTNAGGPGSRIHYNDALIDANGSNLADGNMHSFIYTQRAINDHEAYEDKISIGTSSLPETTDATFTRMQISGYGGLQYFIGNLGGLIFRDVAFTDLDIINIHNWGINRFG